MKHMGTDTKQNKPTHAAERASRMGCRLTLAA